MKMRISSSRDVVPIHRDEMGLFVVYVAVPSASVSHAMVAETLRNDETALLRHARMCLIARVARYVHQVCIKYGRGHGINKHATPAMLNQIYCSMLSSKLGTHARCAKAKNRS